MPTRRRFLQRLTHPAPAAPALPAGRRSGYAGRSCIVIGAGFGLRPGGERPDLQPLIPVLFASLYESIAAHSRLRLNVVVDIGHHDAYARPQHILADSARRLAGLPVLFAGVPATR